MFRNLLSRLTGDSSGQTGLSLDDAEIAVAALLVRVARADGRYSATEQARIERILALRGGLGPESATERRIAAEMIEAEAPDTVRLTRAVKARIAPEDRQLILGEMWRVALADDHRSPDEEALVRLAAGLLGVSDMDSALARRRVLADDAAR